MSSYYKHQTLKEVTDEYRDIIKETVRDLNETHRRSREELQSHLRRVHLEETNDLMRKINDLDLKVFRMEWERKLYPINKDGRERSVVMANCRQQETIEYNITGGVQYFGSCFQNHNMNEPPSVMNGNHIQCDVVNENRQHYTKLAWPETKREESSEVPATDDIRNLCKHMVNTIENDQAPPAQNFDADDEDRLNKLKRKKEVEIMKQLMSFEAEIREQKRKQIEEQAMKEAESMKGDILAKQIEEIKSAEREKQREIARKNVEEEAYGIEKKAREDLESDIQQRVSTNRALRQKYKERFKRKVREEVLADVQRAAEKDQMREKLRAEYKDQMSKEVRDEMKDKKLIIRSKMEKDIIQEIRTELLNNEAAMRRELLLANVNEKEIQKEIKLLELELRQESEARMRRNVQNDIQTKEAELREREKILLNEKENKLKEKELSLRQQIQAEMTDTEAIRKEVYQSVTDDIRQEILRSEYASIKTLTLEDVENDIRSGLTSEILNDETALNKLRKEAEDRIRQDMKEESFDEEAMRAQYKAELAKQISVEEKRAMLEEVRQDFCVNIERELEMNEAFIKQIKAELKSDMEKELSMEVERDVRQDLESKYRAKYELEVMESLQAERMEFEERKRQEMRNEVEESIQEEICECLRRETELKYKLTIEKEVASEAVKMKIGMLKAREKEIKEEVEKEFQQKGLEQDIRSSKINEINEKLDDEIKEMESKLYHERSVKVEQQVDEEVRQLMEEYKDYKEQELEEWKYEYERGRLNDIQKQVDDYLLGEEGILKNKGEAEIRNKLDKHFKTYEEKQKAKMESIINKKYDTSKLENAVRPMATKETQTDIETPSKKKTGKKKKSKVVDEDMMNTSDEIDSMLSTDDEKKTRKETKDIVKSSPPKVKFDLGETKVKFDFGDPMSPQPINDQLSSTPTGIQPISTLHSSVTGASTTQSKSSSNEKGQSVADIAKAIKTDVPQSKQINKDKSLDSKPNMNIKKEETKGALTPLLSRRKKDNSSLLRKTPNPEEMGHLSVQRKGIPPELSAKFGNISHDPRVPYPGKGARIPDESMMPDDVMYPGGPMIPGGAVLPGDYLRRDLPPHMAYDYVDQYGNPVDPQDMAAPGYGYPADLPMYPDDQPPHMMYDYVDKYGNPVDPREMAAAYGYPTGLHPDDIIPYDESPDPSTLGAPPGAQRNFSTRQRQLMSQNSSTTQLTATNIQAPNKTALSQNTGNNRLLDATSLPSTRDLGPSNRALCPLAVPSIEKPKKKKKKDKVKDKASSQVLDASSIPAVKGMIPRPDRIVQQDKMNQKPRDAIDILADRFGPSHDSLKQSNIFAQANPLGIIRPESSLGGQKSGNTNENMAQYGTSAPDLKLYSDDSIISMDEDEKQQRDAKMAANNNMAQYGTSAPDLKLYSDDSIISMDEDEKRQRDAKMAANNNLSSSEEDYGAPDIEIDDEDMASMFRRRDNMEDDFNSNARSRLLGRR